MGKVVSKLGLLVIVALSGCLTASDEGPIMSVGLYWDQEPGKAFVGGDCLGAGVSSMEWKLSFAGPDGDEEIARGEEACANDIDVIDPEPGEYTLEVTGFDALGRPLWGDDCTGLIITRFDVAYLCDLKSPPVR